MTQEYSREIDVEKLKLLFFEPKYGGSRALEQVVKGLVAAHKKMYQYINTQISGDEQRDAEQASRDHAGEEWASASNNLRVTIEQLLDMYPEAKYKKLAAAITTLDLVDPFIESYHADPVTKAASYIDEFATRLAMHYELDARIGQAHGRGLK